VAMSGARRGKIDRGRGLRWEKRPSPRTAPLELLCDGREVRRPPDGKVNMKNHHSLRKHVHLYKQDWTVERPKKGHVEAKNRGLISRERRRGEGKSRSSCTGRQKTAGHERSLRFEKVTRGVIHWRKRGTARTS